MGGGAGHRRRAGRRGNGKPSLLYPYPSLLFNRLELAVDKAEKQIAAGYVTNGAKVSSRSPSSCLVLTPCGTPGQQQVYISSRDASACSSTASHLSSSGPGRCIAIPADLSKLSECQRLISELSAKEDRESALYS